MAKTEWMCIVPDKPNSLQARMAVRRQHFEDMQSKVESGLVVLGGASLEEPPREGEGLKLNGSVLIVVADTKEEVEKVIKEDIYYTSGAWDPEKIQIFPFKSAIRAPVSLVVPP